MYTLPTYPISVTYDFNPSAPPMVLPSYPVPQPQYSYYAPVAPKPVLTKAIHIQTEKLLAKASEMSASILYGNVQNPPSYNPQYLQPVAPKTAPTYNFDFSDKSWKMFNNETHVHHHHHHGEESDKKDDTGTRVLVGVIGLVVAGVAAFFIGKAIAQGEDAAEENQSVEDLKTRWDINKICYEADYQATVDSIIGRMDALSERNQTNRIHKIALLVFGFIGGGTAVAGAIIGSGALMATAGAIGAFVAIAALFKLGYTCFSTRDQKDAQAIEKNLIDLNYMQPAVVV